MTVKELIEKLEDYGEHLTVFVEQTNGKINAVDSVFDEGIEGFTAVVLGLHLHAVESR